MAKKVPLSAATVCAFLNSVLRKDKTALLWLLDYRVRCNKKLCDDLHVQVKSEPGGRNVVGLLGLLNGMLLASGSKDVVAVMSDEGRNKLLGFTVRPYRSGKPEEDKDQMNMFEAMMPKG